MSRVPVFERAVQKAYVWLDELGAALGWTDREHSYAALRVTLHALRDRLPVNEAADLAAQLPLLIRAAYWEGWNPSATPARIRDRATFLAPIARALMWMPVQSPEEVARAVFALLSRKVTRGEIDDLVGTLPSEIRELFPAAVVAHWRRAQLAHAAPRGRADSAPLV
jgi:uncharacterized protein (DUF2267 family)